MKRRICALLGLILFAWSSAAAETLTIHKGRLNLRSGPGQSFAQVGAPLAKGADLAVLERSPDGKWLRIRAEDGRAGWISAKLARQRTKLAKGTRGTPPPPPPPATPEQVRERAASNIDLAIPDQREIPSDWVIEEEAKIPTPPPEALQAKPSNPAEVMPPDVDAQARP